MSLLDKAIVASIPFIPRPVVRHFADPYIAGETLQHAVETVKRLNREGAMATIDVLGEAITNLEQAQRTVQDYLRVLDTVEAEQLDANISIKPTALGLGLNYEACADNFRTVIEKLREYDNFVRIDMEDSPYTTLTLDLVNELRQEYPKIGTVLQAYMRRSMADLREKIIPDKVNLRLCKGIYIEPASIAFKDYEVVRKNYVRLLREALEAGVYVGIATHDELLVWEAFRMIDEMKLEPDQYEFQMLLGVTPELRKHIISEGHKMRVYVPFGDDWYAYSTRRLKENPRVAGYIFKDIFGLGH